MKRSSPILNRGANGQGSRCRCFTNRFDEVYFVFRRDLRWKVGTHPHSVRETPFIRGGEDQ